MPTRSILPECAEVGRDVASWLFEYNALGAKVVVACGFASRLQRCLRYSIVPCDGYHNANCMGLSLNQSNKLLTVTMNDGRFPRILPEAASFVSFERHRAIEATSLNMISQRLDELCHHLAEHQATSPPLWREGTAYWTFRLDCSKDDLAASPASKEDDLYV